MNGMENSTTEFEWSIACAGKELLMTLIGKEMPLQSSSLIYSSFSGSKFIYINANLVWGRGG